jgi:hypothetical protein
LNHIGQGKGTGVIGVVEMDVDVCIVTHR